MICAIVHIWCSCEIQFNITNAGDSYSNIMDIDIVSLFSGKL